MTTDRRTLVAAALTALAMWFAGLAVTQYALEPSRDVIVWAPAERLGAVLSGAPVLLLDGSGPLVKLRGDAPGFVGSLYAGGAWLVLPAARRGCGGRIPPYNARL
jgi:hypothetical protein